MLRICPVIMAGGDGTRLWPLSRRQQPKQFMSLFGGSGGAPSLFQCTLMRFCGMAADVEMLPPRVICNDNHEHIVVEQAAGIGSGHPRLIIQSVVRGTAAAVISASLSVAEEDADAILIVSPSDHVIGNPGALRQALLQELALAEDGGVVLFGVPPAFAATRFGYIEAHTTERLSRMLGFTEKPGKAIAEMYVEGGRHLWNTGVFMARASVWLDVVRHGQPLLFDGCRKALRAGVETGSGVVLDGDAYARCSDLSVDHAVMESLPSMGHVAPAFVVPLKDADWADVGSWDEIWNQASKDENDNVTWGDVVLINARRTLAYADSRLLTINGCDDVVVVESGDAVMVANRSDAPNMGAIIAKLSTPQKRQQLISPPAVQRPWGGYETLYRNADSQVRRLYVHPGRRLSLQYHRGRDERWTVVAGLARVTLGEETVMLGTGESLVVPKEAVHRLENAGEEMLEVIEIQTGDYLDEDDIVRIEDDYGRPVNVQGSGIALQAK